VKTISLPYKIEDDNDLELNLELVLKQYSNVVRYSYNRFLEDKTEKDNRLLTKNLKNIESLNSWLIQCAILDAKAIFKRNGKTKVIFGGKYNFNQRLKNKISKDELKSKRLIPLSIQGEMLQKGNRLFNLDIANNKITFKLSKTKHIELNLPKLKKNYKNDLTKLQELNKVKQGQKGYTYSIRLSSNKIYISFEEFKNTNTSIQNKNRYIGIDMNPDSIGISVLDNGKVICAKEFNLKLIFDQFLDKKLSSNDNNSKYYQNKLKHETIEISKTIANLAKYYNCKSVFIEDLTFKGSSQIKILNRKNKNLWKRDLFVLNLTKRLNEINIDIFKVNPAYSSFVGNLINDFTDPINASIEIARRGYEYKIKRNLNGFYPSLDDVKHQWKETVTSNISNWKDLFNKTKNSKLKYRVSLNESSKLHQCFKLKSYKSKTIVYNFYNKLSNINL